MPLMLSAIIAEADARVPNAFDDAQKVSWLNEVNNEFFDVVKIPAVYPFTSNTSGSYVLPTSVRSKNVELVIVGTRNYSSAQYAALNPGRNYWTLDDSNQTLTISPDPVTGDKGMVRYSKIPMTTFVAGTLTAVPDAPDEYHWVYILGLCERIAKAMDDVARGNNYAGDYRANLQIAQQNFQRQGAGA